MKALLCGMVYIFRIHHAWKHDWLYLSYTFKSLVSFFSVRLIYQNGPPFHKLDFWYGHVRCLYLSFCQRYLIVARGLLVYHIFHNEIWYRLHNVIFLLLVAIADKEINIVFGLRTFHQLGLINYYQWFHPTYI